MADKTISELPAASDLTGNELVLLEQNAEAKKAPSSAFISKVAEEVAGMPEFEQQITDAVNTWLDEHGGGGSGLSDTAKSLILTLFSNALYPTDMSSFVSALEAEFNSEPTPTPPTPPTPGEVTVTQSGTFLIFSNVPTVTSVSQSGTTLTLS